MQIGVIGTILIHALLLLIAPKLESQFGGGALVLPVGEGEPPTYDVELASDDFVIPKSPPPPMNFVEANPDAPENTPDKTQNFSSQSQQVAQEKPDPDGKSESPSTEGEKDIDSTSIVSGTRGETLPPTPPAPPPMPEVNQQTQEAQQEAARRAQDLLAGDDKIEGDNPDGVGSNLSKEAPVAPIGPEKIEGTKDGAEGNAASGAYFKIDPTRPQPRQTLTRSQIRPAILSERVDGTSNIGVIAHSALKTAYGEYLARIIETVDTQWEKNILSKLQAGVSYPLAGSRVPVTFKLHKDGSITITKLNEPTAGDLWNRVAVDAIAAPAPYGAWTDDMIAILGESTDITFTFFYQ